MVVVEGIEMQRQADYFRHVHPGILGQGWLFGRPVPAAHFKRLCSDSLSSTRKMMSQTSHVEAISFESPSIH